MVPVCRGSARRGQHLRPPSPLRAPANRRKLRKRQDQRQFRAPGSKRLEIQFVEPHEHLAVDMFSRRFQIEPKAFIEKMRELDMEVCTLI